MKTATEILCDLISIKSNSEMKTNQEIVCYITDILNRNDIPFTLIPTGNLNNIVAGINVSSLADINDGIVLSGHMDTVDAFDHDWNTNPFQGIQQDDKIIGRGTIDMKYFIAIVLSFIPLLKKISLPILLVFSCDEETDVLGIQDIIKFFSKQKIFPKYAIIGEATDFKLAVSSRGYIGYQTQVLGMAAHAGNPELGTNSIYIASQIISKIEKLNQMYEAKGITLNVGKVYGGEGRNSIPSKVCFDWEIRYKNDLLKNQVINEIDILCKKLEEIYSRATIVTEIKETLPVFNEKEKSVISQVAKNILKTELMSYPYASEAGFWQAVGIDTLICGAGDLNLAHKSNEYIQISDIEKYTKFLSVFLQNISELSE